MGSLCSSNEASSVASNNNKKANVDSFELLYETSERVLSNVNGCQVRICKKKSNQKLYVAKIVNRSANSISNTCLEAEILKKLDHPNIIKLQAHYQSRFKHTLILEYMAHGDLASLLHTITKLPEKTAAEVIRQVLYALNYCHNAGVVHRDIKPENILLDSVGRKGIFCKLADFDSAGLLDRAGKGIYGTLYYTAPEVFGGKYDEKADIWSCGVMLYQLITGRYLFCGSNLEEIQSKINHEDIVFDNSIPSEARDLLEKMLVRDSATRFSALEACNHAWITRLTGTKRVSVTDLSPKVQNSIANCYGDYIIENIYTRKEKKILRNEFSKKDKLFEGFIRVLDHQSNDHHASKDVKLSYSEFLHASIPMSVLLNLENIKGFFNEYDFNRTGWISANDFQMVLSQEKYSDALQEFIKLLSTQESQKVNFQSFYNYIGLAWNYSLIPGQGQVNLNGT